MPKHLILLNGPPSSGKDTAAAFIYQITDRASLFKLSQPLKDAVRAFFDLTPGEIVHYEQEPQKSTPCARFHGLSYRQAQIELSEQHAKVIYNCHVFGQLAVDRIQRSSAQVFICSDSGFDYEAEPLIKYFRPEYTLLLRLHRDGCTFAGDSRSLIHLTGVRTLDIMNNGRREDLYALLRTVVPAWLEGG